MPPNSPLPEALLEQIGAQKHPPVHLWHPPLSGDMDMRIQRDGQWINEGRPILREPLVKLFASILRREGDEYFLVTPVEKWRISVEDAPFNAVALEVVEEGQTFRWSGEYSADMNSRETLSVDLNEHAIEVGDDFFFIIRIFVVNSSQKALAS